MKRVAIVRIERRQQGDDRIPRVGAPRAHDVSAQLAVEAVDTRFCVDRIAFAQGLVPIDPLIVALGDRLEDARIEHTHVTAEADDHQVHVEPGDGARGDGVIDLRKRRPACCCFRFVARPR